MMRFVALVILVLAATEGKWLFAASEVVVEQLTNPVHHGEGPHWDSEEQVLYYVDISEQLVNRYDPATEEFTQVYVDGGPVTPVIPIAGQQGTFLIGLGRNLTILTWDGRNESTPSTQSIAEVDQDKPRNRFNDGKVDRSGRLWAGTMGYEDDQGEVDPKQGSLYTLAIDEALTTKVTDVDISNGLIWNSDDTLMYYIDSPTKKVDAFDFDIATGNISNRRTVFDYVANNVSGVPDGMTIDTNGNLWIACWGGYKVIKVDPTTGELLDQIELPALEVSSVMFGGSALDELYVTTARIRLSDDELQQQPLAGSVFRITGLGVKGFPAESFVYNV